MKTCFGRRLGTASESMKLELICKNVQYLICVLLSFCLAMLVRSHEVKPEGYEYQKGGKVLTVFSAPNYCD